jgi:alpha-amylase
VYLAFVASGASSSAWKSRTIYQVLTDRFAVNGGGSPSCDVHNYCGGTFKGLTAKLDYIQNMGFDAVWISPVVDNTDGGYHGYWARDFSKVNSHFGTLEDLKNLKKELNRRGMYLMIDVVANHAGNINNGDYSPIKPFNDKKYYHDCRGCPSSCNIEDWNNYPQVEHCRLSGLPDLNQTNSFVRSQLKSLLKTLAADNADGLRIDTIPEVGKDFWKEFQQYIGQYAIGEAYNGDIKYVSSFQGPLDGVLSYPMYYTIRDVFAYSRSMRNLGTRLSEDETYFKDTSLLGTFVENHDQKRFLHERSDTWAYRNALVFSLYAPGIPIIYYGAEQGFNGGDDPNNREPLWKSGYNQNSELYKFLKTTIAARKNNKVWNYRAVERWQDDQLYAFTRGETLVVLTNVGGNGSDVERTITYHPYKVGQKLCNIYYPKEDCVTVSSNGVKVKLLHGEPKVYIPSN